MEEKQRCIYILANRRQGTLYIGITSNLVQRIWQHREHQVEGFSSEYGLHRLVHVEQAASMQAAISREKQLKKWRRAWKIELIEAGNPEWRDLWPDILP